MNQNSILTAILGFAPLNPTLPAQEPGNRPGALLGRGTGKLGAIAQIEVPSLAALVLVGAAVGAAKLGLLAPVILFCNKAWKLVIVGLVAPAGVFKNLFAKIFGRQSDQ